MVDIELVIKIPEEIYKASQIIDAKYEDVIQIPLEVIKNGTLLGNNIIIVPEGATIGDAMKIMFPKAEVRNGICPVDEKIMRLLYLNSSTDMSHISIPSDIWNSPIEIIKGEE